MAGLVAALDLSRRGALVRVVEARDRVGGRVYTIRDGFHDGQHAEAGGELIEGEHHRVKALAREEGLTLVRVLRDGFGAYLAGVSGRARRLGEQSTLWSDLRRTLKPALDAYERAGHSWDGPVAQVLAARSVARTLSMLRADPRVCAMTSGLRGFYLADAERLSTLVLLDQIRSDDDPGGREMFRVRGGNDRLATTLAARLGDRVSLGEEAIAIAQSATGVRVTLRQRAGRGRGRTSSLTADYVIVAAPAPIVARLAFSPTLPDPQAQAFRTLPYGPATKSVLQFARPFWRRAGRPRAYGTDLPTGAVWDASEEQRGRAALLVSLAGGSSSRAVRAIVDREGPAGLARQLAWLGGRVRDREPIASVVTTWESDPWARGGYAYFSRGFDPSLRRWLAAPAGRVLFAGEHTSIEWQGYIEGAIESGQRAALEVLALAGHL